MYTYLIYGYSIDEDISVSNNQVFIRILIHIILDRGTWNWKSKTLFPRDEEEEEEEAVEGGGRGGGEKEENDAEEEELA